MTEPYLQNHAEYQKNKDDGIVYPDIENRPLRFAILYRNRWMVEQANLVDASSIMRLVERIKPINRQSARRK